MRIAFFGGTFDPPHCGHRHCQGGGRTGFASIVFCSLVGSQPLKQDSSVASFEDRVAMVKLAVADDTRFELSMVDAPRQDDRPNYTIDTLQGIKSFLGREIIRFAVGADCFSVCHAGIVLRSFYSPAISSLLDAPVLTLTLRKRCCRNVCIFRQSCIPSQASPRSRSTLPRNCRPYISCPICM